MEPRISPIWSPSEQAIEHAQITQFARHVVRKYKLELNTYPEFYQWTVDNPEEFWSEVWDWCGVIASKKGSTVLVDGDKMPGAKWFPDARLNFAENLLRRGDQGDAFVFWDERGFQRRVSYSQLTSEVSRAAQALAAARPAAGRPRRRIHPQHAGDRHARARRAVARHRLVELLARFRHQRRARPLRPDRAEGALRRRRLPLRGARVRRAGARGGDRRGAADAAQGRGGAAPQSAPGRVGDPEGGAARGMAAQAHARRDPVRADAVRASGLHPVQLRHHRHAQVHRARRGRRAAAEPEDAQAAVRHPPRRPLLLLLHDQLGGVEHALPRPVRRGDGDAVRRLAVRARRQDPLGLCREGAHHPFRHLGEVHRRAGKARPRADRNAPAPGHAHDPVHRLAAGARELRLRVCESEGRRVPVVHLGRHRHHVGLCRRESGPAGVPRRDPVPVPGHGGGRVQRSRRIHRRPEGRAGLHQTGSVDAARLLERPRRREVPQRLLREIPQRLDATATGANSPSAAP